MSESDFDPRQAAILLSAQQAFATYGFRKTSMDDIARGAGMSRPALYLHYRNKDDIYRALVEYYYAHAVQEVAAALEGEGSVSDLLAAAFEAQGGEVARIMLTSPHGMEILDAGTDTAGDLVKAGEGRLSVVYALWLSRAAEAGQVRLTGPAEEVAVMLTTVLKGIKCVVPDYPTYRARVAQFAALAGAGLTA
ncbi:TetR/AcrR family transcriptional regulator [Pseudodonghicola flavimaris]|uniref:TetR/AcrR family transcriptional regulator n=1 Tax=Pseudodonghicola flavimaris TaxID=3050036 RepID=A0ABT7EUX1_9RHOB|nr:TetR/AcrR family transcriptional regulator [Pseudodonghicola flavimaris]MDK3016149.1 TetR/AcrR family transcriptional regulator [Pseudodonghicola flavimaris]